MLKSYNYIALILIHILIGIAIYVYEPLSRVYFLIILAVSIFSIINSKTKTREKIILYACAYMVGSEVLLRMTEGNFLYEISKYTVILFLIIGVFMGGQLHRKSYVYFIYLLLLIPGIVVSLSTLNYGTNIRTAITFNLSGPICLGISALFCYRKKVTPKELQNIILAMLLPIIAMTIYVFLYAPSIKDVLSGTQSNFAASGGFGPNQVATILGLGVFLLVSKLLIQSKNLLYKIINIILIVVMAYRAIVTFSRGGVFVAIAIIASFIVLHYLSSKQKYKKQLVIYAVLLVFVGSITWFMSSINTLGLIDKRYTNQDASGRLKEDVTTGRSELFLYEINEFLKNPIFGVGVGKLKELRFEKDGVEAATHNEMSRIIGEHGVFGLVAFSILLFAPLLIRLDSRKNIYFFSFYLFWFLTINHSSMRIAAPAFIYGLCLLNVYYEKPRLHRKQISQ